MSVYASIISSVEGVDAARRAAAKKAREREAAADSDTTPTFEDDIAHRDNVIRGYKASLHNPRVSARAKMQSENILKEKGAIDEKRTRDPRFEQYYARMHDKHLSPEEGYEAEQILEQSGALEFVEDEASHQYNINRGYQATVNNPRVSEEARNHTRSHIKERRTI